MDKVVLRESGRYYYLIKETRCYYTLCPVPTKLIETGHTNWFESVLDLESEAFASHIRKKKSKYIEVIENPEEIIIIS